MQYPKFILTAVALLIAAGCATSPKRLSSPTKERVNASRNEAIPEPVLKNRFTGMNLNTDYATRSRSASVAKGAVANVRTSRLIDMRYKLDMYEHNAKAKQVSDILDMRDTTIRECYSDRVLDTPNLKGTLTFTFRFSRRTPGFHAVQRSGGTIKDSFLESCIAAELQRIPVATFVSGRGELRYSFNVVSQKQSVEILAGEAH